MDNQRKQRIYDVAVIGGGPAGMMASCAAAGEGARTILIEKNKRLGRKLLLTGKGRCNLTNAEFDMRKLVEHYGKNGQFLFHAFSIFGPEKVMEFFENAGVQLKTERGRRVFPISDKATDILEALIKNMQERDVFISTDSAVKSIEKKDDTISKILLKNGEIVAKNYIIATGGKSYPATGSTGDGFAWARATGHDIVPFSPSLTPLKIKEQWVQDLKGLALKNVELRIFQKDKEQFKAFGECLFTHFGLAGPVILDISQRVGKMTGKGPVKIYIDLKPALDYKTLDARIQRDFAKNQNRLFKNSLDALLPVSLIPYVIRFTDIDPEKPVNHITKEERQRLVKTLKGIGLTVAGLTGFESAIATSGGVNLKEIDHRTMKSRIIDNLYFAGEMIDVDGPTGGFNLQICWSTGHLAGISAAKN